MSRFVMILLVVLTTSGCADSSRPLNEGVREIPIPQDATPEERLAMLDDLLHPTEVIDVVADEGVLKRILAGGSGCK